MFCLFTGNCSACLLGTVLLVYWELTVLLVYCELFCLFIVNWSACLLGTVLFVYWELYCLFIVNCSDCLLGTVLLVYWELFCLFIVNCSACLLRTVLLVYWELYWCKLDCCLSIICNQTCNYILRLSIKFTLIIWLKGKGCSMSDTSRHMPDITLYLFINHLEHSLRIS